MNDQFDISDQDVYEAMKDIEGYLDISMSDFRELYKHTYRHAAQRLLHSTRINEIMTVDVLYIEEQTTMEGIMQAMASRSISGLPVVNGDTKVVGVVSEKDIFRQLGGSQNTSFWDILSNCMHINRCMLRSVAGKTAEEMMSSPAVTLQETASAQDAVRLFTREDINRLPIIDRHNRLRGIVTRTNLLQAHLHFDEQ